MEEQPGKPWYKSKTLIVNALATIASALTFLSSPDAKLDTQAVGILGMALGVVNMILRFVTDKPIVR